MGVHIPSVIWDMEAVLIGVYPEIGLFLDTMKPLPISEYVLQILNLLASNILDYFAGSGTTGHAVINLNREDGGNRKYILVEIGHHFETVLLPRMKKVTYSKEWKDGKPKNREGISQLFKYIRLESYEDTLDSLTVNPNNDLVAQAENKQFTEDYQLRYALGEETAENASLARQRFYRPVQLQPCRLCVMASAVMSRLTLRKLLTSCSACDSPAAGKLKMF